MSTLRQARCTKRPILPFRLMLVPFVPLMCGALAVMTAFKENRISSFFPTLFATWGTMMAEAFARNTFWPEAGWCWHYEVDHTEAAPGSPWMTWRKRFVWKDPVDAGQRGWTWSLGDAASEARAFERSARESVPLPVMKRQ